MMRKLNVILIIIIHTFGLFLSGKSNEWCELSCEESELDKFLKECRNACNIDPDYEPKDKMQEYLICMLETCLPRDSESTEIYRDDMWQKCSSLCNREEMLEAHVVTEKSVLHTQYLSRQQFENYQLEEKNEQLKAQKKYRQEKMREKKEKERLQIEKRMKELMANASKIKDQLTGKLIHASARSNINKLPYGAPIFLPQHPTNMMPQFLPWMNQRLQTVPPMFYPQYQPISKQPNRLQNEHQQKLIKPRRQLSDKTKDAHDDS